MIPTKEQALELWERYQLPQAKRTHVTLVGIVCLYIAQKVKEAGVKENIDTRLLLAGALLHDIDKHIPKLLGESHPDTGVRVLQEEGMGEVAALVKTHPLHSILDQAIAPRSWEEKILYLSDKMVKGEIITVDKRFALWKAEDLPPDAVSQLDAAYPKVKELEKEIFTLIHIDPAQVKDLASI